MRKIKDLTGKTFNGIKVIPVVLTGISGIIIKIINQEKRGQINEK